MAVNKARRSEQITPKQNLRKGESYNANSEFYYCYYYDEVGKRCRITSKTLEGLREKKIKVDNLLANRVKASAKCRTLDSVYKEWLMVKRGITEHTKKNYVWVYEHYCLDTELGRSKIQEITRGRIRKHYNALMEQKGLSITTVDGLQTILGQVFKYAIDENYIHSNPSSGAITEIKRINQTRKQAHPALTLEEQNRFLSFIKNHPIYSHWYPMFVVFIGTGMRVAELTGLRWKDIDLENEIIHINHGLLFYKKEGKHLEYEVSKPKTKNAYRDIPMLDNVKKAFIMQKEYLNKRKLACKAFVLGSQEAEEDIYTDFIFLNKDGNLLHQGTINKAINRIIRDANMETCDDENIVVLPKFSCHNFRSTFITRAAENYVPIDVIMKVVGHSDRQITTEIYTTVHPKWAEDEIKRMNVMFE